MNYAQIRGHPPDFEVAYRFFTSEEGGRLSGPPGQHYRCDWAYSGDDIQRDGIFMIHPEFLTAEGEVDNEEHPVALQGTATMWILIPEMRNEVHQKRIKPGIQGYFMEGNKRVAEATVTKIIALNSNPITSSKK
ncbi:hypothetical protein [Prosthecobacter sp.]|jgi:hypothetical protein|uniref:hypothetical protein n=1 Tax=Prosthecobacter sp. TaxID=1965333 RepID=UPI0037CBFDE7